jgi:hypothetical protein
MKHANGHRLQKVHGRNWIVNSILEVFSVTKNRWYVAYVESLEPGGNNNPEMLWLRFWDENNDAKKKLVPRDDQSLAIFGTHTLGDLPPGFQVQASQSRPGATTYADSATCMKYSSAEIAWTVHFQRLRDGPSEVPEHLEETSAPVPRRSPFAIAVGITEEVLPGGKQSLSSHKAASAPSTVVLAPAASGQDRWKQMKNKFAELEAEGQAAENAKEVGWLVAEAEAEIECKEKPQRYCPQLSPVEAEHAIASRTQLPRDSNRDSNLAKAKCKTFDISR